MFESCENICEHWQSAYATDRTRLACALVCLSRTPWANHFLVFTGEQQTSRAMFQGAQIQPLQIHLLHKYWLKYWNHICTEPANKKVLRNNSTFSRFSGQQPSLQWVPFNSVNLPLAKDHSVNLLLAKNHSVNLPLAKDHSVNLPLAKDHPVNLPLAKPHSVNLPLAKDHSMNLPLAKDHSENLSLAKHHSVNLPLAKHHSVNLPLAKDHSVNLPFLWIYPLPKTIPCSRPLFLSCVLVVVFKAGFTSLFPLSLFFFCFFFWGLISAFFYIFFLLFSFKAWH